MTLSPTTQNKSQPRGHRWRKGRSSSYPSSSAYLFESEASERNNSSRNLSPWYTGTSRAADRESIRIRTFDMGG